jgi:hypothetical protein
MLVFVLLASLSERVSLAVVAAMVVGGVLLEWLLAKVELAEQGAPN